MIMVESVIILVSSQLFPVPEIRWESVSTIQAVMILVCLPGAANPPNSMIVAEALMILLLHQAAPVPTT